MSGGRGVSGRFLFWLLLPLLAAALVLHLGLARRRWHVSKVVAVVEAVSQRAQHDPRAARLFLQRNVTLLREARKLDPASIDVPVALGWQYYLLGRSEAALRAYREALELEPRAEIYANLGRTHFRAGDLEAAREAFAKAVALNRRLEKDLGGYLKPTPARSDP